jgi:hypothetical protein
MGVLKLDDFGHPSLSHRPLPCLFIKQVSMPSESDQLIQLGHDM